MAAALYVSGPCVRSSAGAKTRPAPPSGAPGSGPFGATRSMLALALLPRVVVNSAPSTPSVSCQPNGEAVASPAVTTVVRPSAGGSGVVWFGVSTGAA